MGKRRTKREMELAEKHAIALKKGEGLSGKEIARITGLTPSQVSKVMQKYDVNMQELSVFRNQEVNILDKIGGEYLARLCEPETIKKTSAFDCARVYGILKDKSRLISGESTSNIANLSKIVIEVNKRILDKVRNEDATDKELPVDNLPETQDNSLDNPLLSMQVIDSTGDPKVGGGVPGMPAPSARREYIPPVSGASTQKGRKRGRPRKKKEG